MSCPSRRVLALALLWALIATVPAHAATQTVADPTDGFVDGNVQSTDFRSITWDTTSQPGKLLLGVELEFAASQAMFAAVYLDSSGDDRADYAVEITPIAARHPDLAGNNGIVYYRLRAVATSTTECQSYDDGHTIENPFNYPTVPATLRLSDLRTTFTIPIDLAEIGSPATFAWAVVGQSTPGTVKYYDFVTDTTNGLPDLDPHNPPPGERDDWFCSPAGDGLSAGYRVDLADAPAFGGGGGPVGQPPTVSLAQAPALARPGQPVTLTATATDPDGTIAGYGWDLDDDGEFDDATGPSTTRTFATPGSYRVGVRVTDNGGNVAFAYRTIEVATRPLQIAISATKTNPLKLERVTVTAEVSSDAPFSTDAIEWGFDLDNNGDDAEPYNAYRGRSVTFGFGAPGVWTLKARVRNAAGEVATARLRFDVPNQAPIIREFRIRAKQVPDNPFNTAPLVVGQPLILEAIVNDDNLARPRVEWDLDGNGDYDEAVGDRIERTYQTAGPRRVGVRVVDEAGLVTFGDTTFEVRASATASCDGRAGSDGIRAVGCFKPDPVTKTTLTSKEPIKLNGLDIVPKNGAQINVAAGGVLFTSGNGTVEVRAGSVVLFEGRFRMDADCKPAEEECLVGRFASPALANIKGFPLKGDVSVYLTPEGTLTQVEVDVFSEIGGLSGSAEVLTTDTGGLQLNELEIETPEFKIGDVEIGQFSLSYEGKTRRWAGGGEITLPTPTGLGLAGDFAFSEITGFERFHGEVDGLNIPLDEGTVYLQRIAATLEVKGFEKGGSPRIRVGGGLGISAGPRVAGAAIATVDGDFLFTFGDPLGLDIEGRIGILGFDIMGGTVGARSNGHIEMEGQIKFGLPLPGQFKGKRQDATKTKVSKDKSNGADEPSGDPPIVIKGEASAWAEPDAFDLEAAVSLEVIKMRLARAEALISNIGIAGCGEIIGLRAGFGYTYRTDKTDILGLSCDLGPYRPEAQFAPLDDNGAGREPEERSAARARARQAAAPAPTPAPAATAIDVGAGERALVLRLAGTGGDPVVTLVSPDGTRYAMAAGTPAIETARFFAARHPDEDVTFLGVRAPRAGRWQIQPQPGSAPIASVSSAAVLPQPSVRATVRGSGRTRTIDYDVKPIAGQSVAFVEQGSDTHRTVGHARSRRGSITFVPQDGAGRAREVIAIVTQHGLVRDRIAVARFTAPPLRRAARPSGLRVRRGASDSVIATWDRVPGAGHYEVLARLDDGRTRFASIRASRTGTRAATRATLRDIERARGVRVEVRAVDPPARTSRPATATLRAPLRPTIAPDTSGRTTTTPAMDSLLLRCARTRAVITDVYRDAGRVRITGAATRRSVGKAVAIGLPAIGKVVARTRVLGDGSFAATLPAPPARLRGSDRTAYRAEIAGGKPSPAVKLSRRVRFRSMRRTATITTITAHVVSPLARPAGDVVLLRRTGCARERAIARARPDDEGDVRFRVKTPRGVRGVAYRVRTAVRKPGSAREFQTFSLAYDMTLP